MICNKIEQFSLVLSTNQIGYSGDVMHILALPDEVLLSILRRLNESTETCECDIFSNPLTAIGATCTTFARLVRSVFAALPVGSVDLVHPSSLDNEPSSFHPPTPSLASKLKYFHHFTPPSLRVLRLSPTIPDRTVRRLLQAAVYFCESLREIAFCDAGAIDNATAQKLSCCISLNKLSICDARDTILAAFSRGLPLLSAVAFTRLRLNLLPYLQVCLSARALKMQFNEFQRGLSAVYVSIDFGKRRRGKNSEDHLVDSNAPARFVRHIAHRAEHELHAIRLLSITSISWGSVEGSSMLKAHYALCADDESISCHGNNRSKLLVEVQTSPSELDIVDRRSLSVLRGANEIHNEGSCAVVTSLASRRDLASVVRAVTTDGDVGAARQLQGVTVLFDHGRLRTLHDAYSDVPGGGCLQQAVLRNALYDTGPNLSRLDARLSPASPSVSITLIRNLTYVLRFTRHLRTVSFASDWLWSVDSPSFRLNLSQWTGVQHIILTPPVRGVTRNNAHIAECLLPRRLLHFLNTLAQVCPIISCVYLERAPWQPMTTWDNQTFEGYLHTCIEKLDHFTTQHPAINVDSVRMQLSNKEKHQSSMLSLR